VRRVLQQLPLMPCTWRYGNAVSAFVHAYIVINMSFKTDVLAAKKEALRKHPSAPSLKADIEEVWVQHRGMREPQDAGDTTHVPRPWPALDKRCKAVVSTAMRSLLMPEVEAVPNMTYSL
jgi:hypothetical protein